GQGRAALPRFRRGARRGDPRYPRCAGRGGVSRLEHGGRRRARGVPRAGDGGGGECSDTGVGGRALRRFRRHLSRDRGAREEPDCELRRPRRAERALRGVELPPEEDSYPLGTARAQMFENFIVAQNGDALVLVDQHAAHERLVYERFKAELAGGPVASQMQLIPVVIEFPEEDCERLEDAAPTLARLGLYLERFGPRAIAVRETPALLGQSDI